MSAPDLYKSPANSFLQEEVYKLGSSLGVRSLPPGPPRDFLVLTWGPVVYVTSYTADSKRLLRPLLQCFNDAVRDSIHRNLTGSDDLYHRLETTYLSKVFNSEELYDGMDVDGVREAFRAFKLSLAVPTTDLPSRMRTCVMADEDVFAKSAKELDKYTISETSPDPTKVYVKMVEENFPDDRYGEKTYITKPNSDDQGADDEYRGITTIALSALVEVFNGLRQGKFMVEYHRKDHAYIGEGKWHQL